MSKRNKLDEHYDLYGEYLIDVVPAAFDDQPFEAEEDDPDFKPGGRRAARTPIRRKRPAAKAEGGSTDEDEELGRMALIGEPVEQAIEKVETDKTPEKAKVAKRIAGRVQSIKKGKADEAEADARLRAYLLSDEFRLAIVRADLKVSEASDTFHGKIEMDVWGLFDFPGGQLEREYMIFLCNQGSRNFLKFKDLVLPDGQLDESNITKWTRQLVTEIFLIPSSATKFSGTQDHNPISMPVAARIKFSVLLMKRVVHLWLVFFSIFNIKVEYGITGFIDDHRILNQHLENQTEISQMIPFVLKHMAVWGYTTMAMNIVNTLQYLRVMDMLHESVTKGVLDEWTFAIEALTVVQFHPSYH